MKKKQIVLVVVLTVILVLGIVLGISAGLTKGFKQKEKRNKNPQTNQKVVEDTNKEQEELEDEILKVKKKLVNGTVNFLIYDEKTGKLKINTEYLKNLSDKEKNSLEFREIKDLTDNFKEEKINQLTFEDLDLVSIFSVKDKELSMNKGSIEYELYYENTRFRNIGDGELSDVFVAIQRENYSNLNSSEVRLEDRIYKFCDSITMQLMGNHIEGTNPNELFKNNLGRIKQLFRKVDGDYEIVDDYKKVDDSKFINLYFLGINGSLRCGHKSIREYLYGISYLV